LALVFFGFGLEWESECIPKVNTDTMNPEGIRVSTKVVNMKQKKMNRMLLIPLVFSMVLFQCKGKMNISEPDEKAAFHKGIVEETMDSNGYTYILLKTDAGKHIWVACLATGVKKGDKVTAPQGHVMRDFTSKSLKKTFPSILFVERVEVEGAMSTGAHGDAPNTGSMKKTEPAKVDMTGFVATNVKGRITVGDCYQNIDKLNGQTVTVRGKVVKFLPGIMNKNWIHLQDGTGKEGANDLVVTTQGNTKAGEIVVITGKLEKNKDFGSGYKYAVIVEDARIAAE